MTYSSFMKKVRKSLNEISVARLQTGDALLACFSVQDSSNIQVNQGQE